MNARSTPNLHSFGAPSSPPRAQNAASAFARLRIQRAESLVRILAAISMLFVAESALWRARS